MGLPRAALAMTDEERFFLDPASPSSDRAGRVRDDSFSTVLGASFGQAKKAHGELVVAVGGGVRVGYSSATYSQLSMSALMSWSRIFGGRNLQQKVWAPLNSVPLRLASSRSAK